MIYFLNYPLDEEKMESLYKYDVNSSIGIRVNALYVKAVTFILLHEFSHHSLNHDFNRKGTVDEEIEADSKVFWSICNDLEGKDKNTAMRGILCALVSFLFVNPQLIDDGIHPKPIDRIFEYYDYAQDICDSTAFLCYLFLVWAVYIGCKNFPKLDSQNDYSELLKEIKVYFYKK